MAIASSRYAKKSMSDLSKGSVGSFKLLRTTDDTELGQVGIAEEGFYVFANNIDVEREEVVWAPSDTRFCGSYDVGHDVLYVACANWRMSGEGGRKKGGRKGSLCRCAGQGMTWV